MIKNVKLIDDIRVNVTVPDVVSLPLGGGTIIHVNEKDGSVQVGPDSVAYRLEHEALAFGGQTITGTDIAIAAGLATGVRFVSILNILSTSFVFRLDIRLSKFLSQLLNKCLIMLNRH